MRSNLVKIKVVQVNLQIHAFMLVTWKKIKLLQYSDHLCCRPLSLYR